MNELKNRGGPRNRATSWKKAGAEREEKQKEEEEDERERERR